MLDPSQRKTLSTYYLKYKKAPEKFKELFKNISTEDLFYHHEAIKDQGLISEEMILINGITKFHLAAYCGWEIEGLFESGNINIQDSLGNTPFDYAAYGTEDLDGGNNDFLISLARKGGKTSGNLKGTQFTVPENPLEVKSYYLKDSEGKQQEVKFFLLETPSKKRASEKPAEESGTDDEEDFGTLEDLARDAKNQEVKSFLEKPSKKRASEKPLEESRTDGEEDFCNFEDSNRDAKRWKHGDLKIHDEEGFSTGDSFSLCTKFPNHGKYDIINTMGSSSDSE